MATFDIATYSEGPTFYLDKPLTKGQMKDVLDQCRQTFGPSYDFVLEPITEGGLQMTKCPQLEVLDGYKAVRFNVHGLQWPWIGKDVEELWRGEQKDDVLCPKGLFHTTIRAFYGAPAWTGREYQALQLAFNRAGIRFAGRDDFEPDTL
jgi:hypothetical protein